MSDRIEVADVVALRPFVPAKDLAVSMRFYAELGFTVSSLGSALALVELGPFGFLLQQYDVPSFAENYMMHLLVNDLDAWWERIQSLDLATRYGVRAPTAPAMQPWGLRVTYVVDPTSVLWHFAQHNAAKPAE